MSSIVRVEGFATPDAPAGGQVKVTPIAVRDPLTLKSLRRQAALGHDDDLVSAERSLRHGKATHEETFPPIFRKLFLYRRCPRGGKKLVLAHRSLGIGTPFHEDDDFFNRPLVSWNQVSASLGVNKPSLGPRQK